LKKLISYLKERENDIFSVTSIGDIKDESDTIVELLREFNYLIDENNLKTKTLAGDQKKANLELRLSDVAKFLKDIDYTKQLGQIEILRNAVAVTENEKKWVEIEIGILNQEKKIVGSPSKR
jgi:hypothetical protein